MRHSRTNATSLIVIVASFVRCWDPLVTAGENLVFNSGHQNRKVRQAKLADGAAMCAAEIPSGQRRVGVRLGHSAMPAQYPVCPKADMAGRFMSTRPSQLDFPCWHLADMP